MDKIIDFWNRNKVFIFSLLAFLLIMNLCGRLIMPPRQQEVVTREVSIPEESAEEIEDSHLKTYDELIAERTSKRKSRDGSFFRLVFWLIAIALIGYYLVRKGWVPSFMPQWVSFRITLLKQKSSGNTLVRINISNNTRESKTFHEPCLLFKRWTKSRKFKIKNDLFPLTLTPGTSHSVVIDVQQFYDKVSDLKGFNRIGAVVATNTGKIYKTKTYPRWLVMKQI